MRNNGQDTIKAESMPTILIIVVHYFHFDFPFPF